MTIRFLINLLRVGSYSWGSPLCCSVFSNSKSAPKTLGPLTQNVWLVLRLAPSLHFQQAARWLPCWWPGVHWWSTQLRHLSPFCSLTTTASFLDSEEMSREGQRETTKIQTWLCSLLHRPKTRTLCVVLLTSGFFPVFSTVGIKYMFIKRIDQWRNCRMDQV